MSLALRLLGVQSPLRPLFARRRQDPVIAARAAEVGRASWTALVRTAELRGHLQEARYYGAGRAGFDDVMEALTGLARTKPEALGREAMAARGGVRGSTCEPTTRIPDRSAGREGDG